MNGATDENVTRGMDSTVRFCLRLPPKINSAGIWGNQESSSSFLSYSLPLVELQMLLIYFFCHGIHYLFRRTGVPVLASQIMAGIILGPGMLGQIDAIKNVLFPADRLEIIDTLAHFGFGLFLFLIGVKMNVGMAFRAPRRAAVIGVASLIFPVVNGLLFNSATGGDSLSNSLKLERLCSIAVQSLTPYPVVSCLLSELKILNSELGRLALSSATISDMCAAAIFGVIIFTRLWAKSPAVAIRDAVAMTAFHLSVVFIFRPIMDWIIRRTPEGRPVKDVYIFSVMLLALGSSLYTHIFDHTALLGALMVGLAVPDGPPLGSALVDKFECYVSGVFLPLYVTTATMRADPQQILFDLPRANFSSVLLVLSFITKVTAALMPALCCRMPLNDALALALILSSKGIVEITFYSTFKDGMTLSEVFFSVMIIGVLLNSAIVPILVKHLYDSIAMKSIGYQKRNLLHLKPNAELRVLVCVHRPDNVAPYLELLGVTFPTKESPNVVYVLHQMEMVGRSSPVFITHRKQQTESSVAKRSFENVILDFTRYEQNNWGLVTVNAFTAISPPKLMHEDICTLALDKQVSLILLPFHRKWSMAGIVESESKAMRNLNCSVLKRAPSSVGILVDRGITMDRLKLKSRAPSRSERSTYCVGMIFFGGKDDREALTLAKRMAKDPKVSLTVIHFVSEEEQSFMDWNMMLDAEALRDVKQNNVGDGNVMYTEEVVKDGPQTALIVRSIVHGYDLIIVGRRYGVNSAQTSGLSQWLELPELGIIGDLLASTDIHSRTSTLIVQQQHFVDA